MAIKSPPGLIPLSHLSGEELLAHLRFNRVTDEKGRYLPFDELQYRIKKGENVDVAWTLTRLARNAAIQRINYCNEAGEQAGFNITPVIAEACELVDKRATALALKNQTERLRGAGAELSQLRLKSRSPAPSWKVRILQRWWREKCWKQGGRHALKTSI